MSKVIKIKESGSLGFDLTVLDIYHTSIDDANLLASVSASVLTGSDGYTITGVDDSYTTFWAKCTTGICSGSTASLNTIASANPASRYLNFYAVGSLSLVSQISPVTINPTGSYLAAHNFLLQPLLVVNADTGSTQTFASWHSAATGGTQLSTSNPLTITSDDFLTYDNFYARFTDIIYSFAVTVVDNFDNATVSTPLTQTVTGISGSTHTVTWDITPGLNRTLFPTVTSDNSLVTTAVSDLSNRAKRITATVNTPGVDSTANLTVTGTSTLPTFAFSDWTGGASVSIPGTVSLTLGNAVAVSNSPSQNFPEVGVDTVRSVNCLVTVPAGYTNSGGTVSGTKSVTQPDNLVDFTFSDWTGNAFVAIDGDITFQVGNAQSVTNSPVQSVGESAVDRQVVVNCSLLVPSGYNNSGATVTGTKTVTQLNNLVPFTFSDWSGAAAVASNGDISFTTGNAASVTNNPAQNFNSVNVNTNRIVNCLVTVPAGYTNSGGTVSGTKSVTQSLIPTFAFSDWTGTVAVAALDGAISITAGNATSATNLPSQSFAAVDTAISRTINVSIVVPSGYYNTGATLTGTKSTIQSAQLPQFTFSDWTGTVAVNTSGVISITTGNAASATNSPAQSTFALVNTNTNRVINVSITAPSGYRNAGSTLTGTKNATQGPASTFAFSDWSGGVSVSQGGSISISSGNAASATVVSPSSFPLVASSEPRTVNVSIVVPSGYYNSGNTLTGTASDTQAATPTFAFSDWTGGISISQAGSVSISSGNAASATVTSSTSLGVIYDSNQSHTANVSIVVPSGYYNSGNTLTGTSTATHAYSLRDPVINGFSLSAGSDPQTEIDVFYSSVSYAGVSNVTITWGTGASYTNAGSTVHPAFYTNTTKTITGLTAGTDYNVRITANNANLRDGNNDRGTATTSEQATIRVPLAAPVINNFTGVELGTDEIETLWDSVTGATGNLTITWGTGGSYTNVGSGTSTSFGDGSFNLESLSPNTDYYIRMTASNGDSSTTATTTVRTAVVLSNPSLSVEDGGDDLDTNYDVDVIGTAGDDRQYYFSWKVTSSDAFEGSVSISGPGISGASGAQEDDTWRNGSSFSLSASGTASNLNYTLNSLGNVSDFDMELYIRLHRASDNQVVASHDAVY